MKQSDGPDCSTGSKYSDFKMFLVINVTFFFFFAQRYRAIHESFSCIERTSPHRLLLQMKCRKVDIHITKPTVFISLTCG